MIALSNLQLVKYVLGVYLVIFAVFIGILCTTHNSNSKYIRIGPHDDLKIFDIAIDTWGKYALFQIFLLAISILEIASMDVAIPIFNFRIYDPDLKVITDFTKFELQAYNASINFLASIRNILMVVASVSQIDLAILKAAYFQVLSIWIANYLLSKKSFGTSDLKEPFLSNTA
jgi:hypothetical protein